MAAATVLAGIVLLIVFRKRTTLTGCGSKKVMELNHICDDTSREELVVEEGPSTIFGELEMEEDDSDALEDQDDTEQTEMDASKAEQDADTDEEEYDDGDEN